MVRVVIRKLGQTIAEKELDAFFADSGCVLLLNQQIVFELHTGQRKKKLDYEAEIIYDTSEKDLQTRQDADSGEDNRDDNEVRLEIHPLLSGYEFTGFLGRGGMGTVWKAIQLSTKRTVAVKTINPQILNLPGAKERFHREVELAAKLNHPHIAHVYDSGIHDGSYYYSMEFINGMAWNEYVNKHKPKQDQIIAQLIEVLAAIAEAHNHSIIHRDLKPSNILIDEKHHAHVVDFGLAKPRMDDNTSFYSSTPGEITGTLAFMSPEQASGKIDQIDNTTDLFSLATVLLYLLNGTIPYDMSGTPFDLQRRIADGKILNSAVELHWHDETLVAIILKALALNPAQRYRTAAAFSQDLQKYLSARSEQTLIMGPADFPTKVMPKPVRKTSILLVVTVLLLSGLLGYKQWYVPRIALTNSTKSGLITQAKQPSLSTQYIQTEAIGAKRNIQMMHLPKQQLPLVGMHVRTMRFKDDEIIKSVQPIYYDPRTKEYIDSEILGIPKFGNVITLRAPDGYAVGGLSGIGGIRLHALQLHYYKLTDQSLDLNDSQRSQWVGGHGDNNDKSVGGTGEIVVGLHGTWQTDIGRLGLVLLNSKWDPSVP